MDPAPIPVPVPVPALESHVHAIEKENFDSGAVGAREGGLFRPTQRQRVCFGARWCTNDKLWQVS